MLHKQASAHAQGSVLAIHATICSALTLVRGNYADAVSHAKVWRTCIRPMKISIKHLPPKVP